MTSVWSGLSARVSGGTPLHLNFLFRDVDIPRHHNNYFPILPLHDFVFPHHLKASRSTRRKVVLGVSVKCKCLFKEDKTEQSEGRPEMPFQFLFAPPPPPPPPPLPPTHLYNECGLNCSRSHLEKDKSLFFPFLIVFLSFCNFFL